MKLSVVLQYLLPHHLFSRFIGLFARLPQPWFKNRLITWFIKRYKVDMSQALHERIDDYTCFNDFFTRELKPELRPIAADKNQVVSPADGVISQVGDIKAGKLLQAKGHEFSLKQLLGDQEQHAKLFVDGKFATIYLSPKDYHRVHMPIAGKLVAMSHIPGRLFSVNTLTAQHVPSLFARNERVVSLFETEIGPMAVILVGAMIVASINTVWAGTISPPGRSKVQVWEYPEAKQIQFAKGDEMGHFMLGSTVIVLAGKNALNWEAELSANSPVIMGQTIATTRD